MVIQALAAVFGTMSFALLFGVPKKYYLPCGIIGAIGWMIYYSMTEHGIASEIAIFLATIVVVLCSRYCAVLYECPATPFTIAGIFPLVPGGGIYWTSYYLVRGYNSVAAIYGNRAIRAAFCIVLGIVVVHELPYKVFNHARWMRTFIKGKKDKS